MGQYLAIGLATRISVDRAKLKALTWSLDLLSERMQDDLTIDLTNYQLESQDDWYLWTLRPELVADTLLSFLEVFYPALYPRPGGENDSEAVLQGLRERDPADWLDWAEGKPYYSFQADSYGMSDYLSDSFGRKVGVHYHDLILSMEGKIVMEEYGRQFHFWKQCMAHRFGEFDLARSLRIYLTG